MRKYKINKMWFMALLLVVFVAGCGRERGTIPPTLISISPNAGVQGQTKRVTLTGTNFATGATVNVGGALITVTNTAVVSSTQIIATFAIAANATLGAANISVTTSGVTTNTVPFTIRAPLLTSIAPNGGVQGQTEDVTLTGTDFATGATVNVGGALITVLHTAVVSSTQITAIFAIAAHATLGAANISVTTSGVTTNTVPFTIRPPLAVISTTPGNGTVDVPLNTSVSATFNLALNCSTLTPLTFVVSIIGVPVRGSISACSGATVTFTPTSNLAPNVIYSATITTGATDLAGDGLLIPYVWSFSTVLLPQVISTVPLNGASGVPINQALSATFSEAMDPATLNSPATNFTLKTTVGGVAVPGTVHYVAAGLTATFTPTLPLNPTTQYTATISTGAQDPAGNGLLNPYPWTFTTGAAPDTTQPVIISTIPLNGAPAVPINQVLSATFSEAMNPATLSSPATNFTLTGPGGPVPGTVIYGPIANTVTFSPTSPLAGNTLYTARVTTGATDLAGNPLGPGLVPNPWTFTTAPVLDSDIPTIISTNPADASGDIPVNATVNATFSEAMNPSTISTTTFLLVGPGAVVIDGRVGYDPINFIATFFPSSDLLADTTYTATVTTGATDLSGNPLGPGLVPNPWSFTTAAVLVPPAVPLGTASTFGGFGGGAGMTNQGILTVINGDIGTTGASSTMTGFHDTTVLPYIQFTHGCIYTESTAPPAVGKVNGTIYTAPGTSIPSVALGCTNEGTGTTTTPGTTAYIAYHAWLDATAAYTALLPANRPGGAACPGSGNGAGLTLAPGTYTCATTFDITGGDLTLDGGGDANAVWVFQVGSALTVGDVLARSVILKPGSGAQAKNVFWQVGTSAVINYAGGGTMVGTIIANAGVTLSSPANSTNPNLTVLNGRALGLGASTTMVQTVINVPAP